MSAKSVKLHLSKYGLKSKEPQKIEGALVLGLKVFKLNGKLYWKIYKKPLDSDEPTTKRHLFSYGGKVIGHFPVCGWLRPS
ncbi:hypothetical protein GJ496_003431 [Pomphorhynchus laevis]|nr:hypothetical protein GJ496_003431 [Pomphorhynchus laevis]